MDKEASRVQSEYLEKYYEQVDKISEYLNAQAVSNSVEGYEGYPITVDEKGRGDYTTLDGEVITSRFNQTKSHVDVANEVYDQIEALYEPVADLQKYVDGAFVKEGIGERFEDDFGFSSENWSPEKSGDGKPRGDSSFVDPFANEIKPNLGAKPGDELALGGVNYDLYNWYVKTYGAGAAGWYMNNPGSNPKNNPFLPGGAYVPKASLFQNLGSVASVGGVDSATAAATAAAASGEKKKKGKGRNNPMLAHYQPKGDNILEKYARPIPEKKDLFERVKSKGFFNQNDIKPIFPENPPPKLDPKTGMHPQYGKKAGRYKKLDPISANSMPPTGDPEIDAVVNKQKTINKIKKMARNK